jgi:hypothetical protein
MNLTIPAKIASSLFINNFNRSIAEFSRHRAPYADIIISRGRVSIEDVADLVSRAPSGKKGFLASLISFIPERSSKADIENLFNSAATDSISRIACRIPSLLIISESLDPKLLQALQVGTIRGFMDIVAATADSDIIAKAVDYLTSEYGNPVESRDGSCKIFINLHKVRAVVGLDNLTIGNASQASLRRDYPNTDRAKLSAIMEREMRQLDLAVKNSRFQANHRC